MEVATVEVRAGIEPAFKDLQSSASPLCHRTAKRAALGQARYIPREPSRGQAQGHAPVSPRARPGYKPRSFTTGPKMDLPTLDYAAARDHMVDSQIRPNRIVDPRIIRAMRTLPRERFVPPHLASMAYIDEDLALPEGRNLMEPLVLARLVQLARIRAGERALVVGAGSGYGAAVLRLCSAAVTALEEDAALLAIARNVLPAVAPGVTVVEGKLQAGLKGPWDVILIEGAVREIPAAIGAELDPHGGRLVTVLAQSPGLGSGVLAEPINPGSPEPTLRAQPHFDCATPYLPAFRAAPAFQF